MRRHFAGYRACRIQVVGGQGVKKIDPLDQHIVIQAARTLDQLSRAIIVSQYQMGVSQKDNVDPGQRIQFVRRSRIRDRVTQPSNGVEKLCVLDMNLGFVWIAFYHSQV